MKINCNEIAREIKLESLKKLKTVFKSKEPPTVALFYVGQDELTEIFIKKKKELAQEFGFKFKLFHYPETPMFQHFVTDLRATAYNRNYHAVIIQRPLPPELNSPTIENFIPLIKEVEGQKYKSPFIPPVGLTTLSILKYIHSDFQKWKIKPSDAELFKRNFKKKFIVLAGRGKTTGQPIAKTLVNFKLALVITHIKTPNPDQFYKQADILISATGKSIIHNDNIKEGAVLLNFGYHFENGQILGDYKDEDIKNKAGFYTPTIKGTGPIMLAYLMRNIVEAYAKQVR